MRPVVFTVTGAGTSKPMVPDQYISPFNMSLGATVTGTATYTVQYTFDNALAEGYNPATGNWIDHPALTAQTTSKDSNVAYPVGAIRLVVASGAGSVRLTIIQAGGGGRA